MRRWLPWLIAGGAIGLVVANRKRPETLSVTTAELDAMMAKAYSDGAFNSLVKELAATGGTSPEVIKARRTGPLQVTLDVEANAIEKFFAGDITEDVRQSAIKMGQQLRASCPGAPMLAQSQPDTVRVSATGSGFRVVLIWPAAWASDTGGPVRDQVRECMEKLVKVADPELGSRLQKFEARRL